MNKIYLTSQSQIKKDAVLSVYPNATIISIKNENVTLPQQPIGTEEGVMCAKSRIPDKQYDRMVISIENFIRDDMYDSVCVIIKHPNGNIWCSVGGDKPLHSQYKTYVRTIHGTYGEYISTIYKDLDPKNWVNGGRVSQISSVLRNPNTTITHDTIGGYLDYTPDFPKPGVLFKDMSPLFDAYNIKKFIDACTQSIGNIYFKHVIGLESRGFHIGALIAKAINASFHMARKAGKLPPPTVTVKYGTEYSTDAMEMKKKQLSKGKILIVDDLIATGGSISAVAQIVKQITVPDTKIYCFAPLYVGSLKDIAMKKIVENNVEWIKLK